MSMTLDLPQLTALADRLVFMADVGDMGRKPDPTCTLRKAASGMRALIAELTAARERLAGEAEACKNDGNLPEKAG